MTRRYTRRERVLWRRSGDAVVLLPADGSQVFTLEGSGVDLWQLLAEPIALDEAASALANAYGTTSEQVAKPTSRPCSKSCRRRDVIEATE